MSGVVNNDLQSVGVWRSTEQFVYDLKVSLNMSVALK
jgi:hypothetical protein